MSIQGIRSTPLRRLTVIVSLPLIPVALLFYMAFAALKEGYEACVGLPSALVQAWNGYDRHGL